MKKLLPIILAGIVLATQSQANAKDGAYVGADLILSNARYKHSAVNNSNPQNRVDGNSVGGGLSLGYKKSFDQVFAAPEIFYDYLNSSTKDYYRATAPYQQDRLELRSRYGAKLNLGYNFTKNFSSYLTYGLAAVDHVDNAPSLHSSQGKWKTAAIYGFGAVYNLNGNWAVKTEFNTQRFNVPYAYDYNTSKVRLNVLKVGLAYNF